MDGYPPELVTHESPLLIISGLGSSSRHSQPPSYPELETNGSLISCPIAPVTTPAGELLLDHFLKADSLGVWAGRAKTTQTVQTQAPPTPAWRVRAVGRDYTLPPRKASPPTTTTTTTTPPSSPIDRPSSTLHSPISPLTPSSPLYPDGLLSPLWLRKHQSLLPAAFTAAYEVYTATNDIPLQNQHDNALIAAINTQKKFFSPGGGVGMVSSEDVKSSGWRSRFAVVLLSEKSILSSPRIDERLTYIKRSTNLVPGSTFFFLPAHSSPVEVSAFVATLLTTLQPAALEYYRDLTKHTRRKRNRSSIPPPTIPSSRALSLPAWSARYDLKLGILAEFRNELDAAARNYESAYEKLLSEVFSTTTSWSSRWTEARLLADTTSLRIIRCYLAAEPPQYSAAKRRWGAHVAAMTRILDEKGLGTGTYGWAAWMSRWNRCLAELLVVAELAVFLMPLAPPRGSLLDVEGGLTAPSIWAVPEKALAAECGPGDVLHHAGFYFLQAAEYMAERARRAKRVSLEDKESNHDTYLCPGPSEEVATDHTAPQIELLLSAQREFATRGQARMVSGVGYRIAKLRMASKAWGEALKELRGAAGIYRKEGWWNVLEEVLWGVVECGHNCGDGGAVVVAVMELLCSEVFRARRGWRYDLGRCLEGVEAKVRPAVVVRGGEVVSFLTASYSFSTPTAHVGDPLISQLTLTSTAQPSSVPVTFTTLKISFDGPLKPIHLHHSPSTSNNSSTRKHDLKGNLTEGAPALSTDTDLTLHPGQTVVYELSTIPRDSGDARAVTATASFAAEGFEMDLLLNLDSDGGDVERAVHVLPSEAKRRRAMTANGGSAVWWLDAPSKKTGGEEGSVELKGKPLRAPEPAKVSVLPRPPKMDVVARSDVVGDVYVNEPVRITFSARNGEEEDAVVAVEVSILGWPGDDLPKINWHTSDGASVISPAGARHPLGTLSPFQSQTRTFTFTAPPTPSDCAIAITAHYHLISDPATPIAKPVTAEMPVVNPFATSFDFSPRVHPDPWPDYFSLPDDPRAPLGITQRWALTTTMSMQCAGAVEIVDWGLVVIGSSAGVAVNVLEGGKGRRRLERGCPVRMLCEVDVQRMSLEDRRAGSADVVLRVWWVRAGTTTTTSTTSSSSDQTPTMTELPVPRLPIPGSEPRVLATVISPSSSILSSISPFSPEDEPTPGAGRARSRTTTSLVPTPAVDLAGIPGLVQIEYVLENPTSYFLTFGVVMEASEGFAFSGPKQSVVQVLPVARVRVGYRLFAYGADAAAHSSGRAVEGGDRAVEKERSERDMGRVVEVDGRKGVWVRPGLRVVDRYFNKTLRVSPGSEGVGMEKGGVMVWVPVGGEEEEEEVPAADG